MTTMVDLIPASRRGRTVLIEVDVVQGHVAAATRSLASIGVGHMADWNVVHSYRKRMLTVHPIVPAV